jgi:hypothetical protein
MRQILYLFEPGAILFILVALSFVVMTIVRGRQIPQCYHCGAIKVRPSRPAGILDLVGTFVLIRSYRCAGCRERFHAMRLMGRSRPDSVS